MNKRIKLLVYVTAVFTLVGAYAVITAQAGNSAQNSPVPTNPGEQAETVLGSRHLHRTYISYDNFPVEVDAGFQAIDSPLTVVCPGTSGTCTIVAEQNLQLSGTTTGNRWSTCLAVDGVYSSEPYCPYMGYVPSDGSFTTGSFSQAFSGLPVGRHTVQSFLYTFSGGSRSIYSIHYRVYKP
jgi:hypothetical protein